MEIASSARPHAVSDDDIRHAIRHAIAAVNAPAQPDFTLLIGADTTGRLIDVGVLADDDEDYIIHAMPARPRYLLMVAKQEGEDS